MELKSRRDKTRPVMITLNVVHISSLIYWHSFSDIMVWMIDLHVIAFKACSDICHSNSWRTQAQATHQALKLTTLPFHQVWKYTVFHCSIICLDKPIALPWSTMGAQYTDCITTSTLHVNCKEATLSADTSIQYRLSAFVGEATDTVHVSLFDGDITQNLS